MKINPCTKQAICFIAFALVVIFFIVVFGLIITKNKSSFTMNGPLSNSRGQKGRRLNKSEFYRSTPAEVDYNLSAMANKGSNRPGTINTVNPNWVRRRVGTTVNSIVADSNGIAQFPLTSNTNAPQIGDSNWRSNPFV